MSESLLEFIDKFFALGCALGVNKEGQPCSCGGGGTNNEKPSLEGLSKFLLALAKQIAADPNGKTEITIKRDSCA